LLPVFVVFEVDTTIRCRVVEFLLLIRYVTLTFGLLTLDSGHTCGFTWSNPLPSLKILCVSVILTVMTTCIE